MFSFVSLSQQKQTTVNSLIL